MTAPPEQAPAALAYTRAYVVRDAAAPGQPGDPIRFVAANEGQMRDGIDLRMSGARLERYRANPVVGYNHSYWGRDGLPIARGENTSVVGDQLFIDAVFDQDDEFARKVEAKYRAGFLNAVSIGFNVWAWEDGKGSYWTGGVAQEWELTELSCVPIPMDPDAVVTGGRSAWSRALAAPELAALVVPVEIEHDEASAWLTVRVSDELARSANPLALSVSIAKAFERAAAEAPKAVEAAPVDEGQAPEAEADVDAVRTQPAPIDPVAAQDLLAAFTAGGTTS